MKQTQKEAVYNAVQSTLKEHGVQVKEGASYSKYMTREYRAMVNAILFQGFKAGSIEMETPELLNSDSDLKAYVSGLQSNWLRKDIRLNGGTKYTPANPGIRTGGADEQLKALRTLLGQTTDAATRKEIQGYIDGRVSEINAAKRPKPQVDINHLPAPLRAKYVSQSASA